MSGISPQYRSGPLTYEVSATVVGGQLLTIDGSTGKVKPTTGTGDKVLGVAHTDALPAGTALESTDALGRPVDVVNPQSQYVAVGYTGVYKLVANETLAFGDLVKSATAGKVAKLGAFTPGTTDPTTIVGRVVNVDGAASGALASVRLTIS